MYFLPDLPLRTKLPRYPKRGKLVQLNSSLKTAIFTCIRICQFKKENVQNKTEK